MNSRLAKKLRRLAERSTEGAPMVEYARNAEGTRRIRDRACTRGVYLSMKAAAQGRGRGVI